MKKWYEIKASNPKYKAMGEHKFWLYRENKKEVHELALKKGYQNIKWIREGIPPFFDK
jgi:hypothetical protein